MKNLDKELIVRIVVSILSIVNMIAANNGWNPLDLDENDIYVVVSTIIAIVTWIWGFWKNNNFTIAAKEGQKVIDEIKNENKRGGK